jgi:hypothetical protein
MDQEHMNGVFCHSLSFCFELEELDLTGDKHVGDEGIGLLSKGDVKLEGGLSQVIGLKKLRILKLSGLAKVSDHPLLKLCTSSMVLEHVELTKCEGVTEYCIDMMIK